MISMAKTDVGLRRSNNEDYVFASDNPVGMLPNLYIVADGMGGHNGGEIASSSAVNVFIDFAANSFGSDISDILAGGVKAANSAVFAAGIQNVHLRRMGTTMDCVCIKDNKVYIAHVGDSRVYRINDDTIECLTNDHSYVMDLVRAGIITREEADSHPDKNMITRAVGVDERVECDIIVSPLGERDIILLCSDGLFDMLSENDIFSIVKNYDSLEKKIDMLIDEANRLGGRDNVSVILVSCNGGV